MLKNYPENMTGKQIYDLVKSPDIGKLRDIAGQTIGLTAFVLHEDTDQDGEITEVLNVRDEDGNVYATNSKPFIREFKNVLEYVKDDMSQINHIAVLTGKSKGGRTYITMKWVD